MKPVDVWTLISDTTYALILSSPRLQSLLLPEGLACSPYRVLDYDATLVLDDNAGAWATFQRSQTIQFQQQGVSAILDHYWGDGVPLTFYDHGAGRLSDSIRDGDRRHLVIDLGRPMDQGERLAFTVERRAAASFSTAHEWVETVIDHPIDRFRRRVLFPLGRPVLAAWLDDGQQELRQPIRHLSSGRTLIDVRIAHPQADTPYVIHWTW